MGRFSRIKQGAELNQALDNYVNYIRDTANRPTKRLQGGTRGARRKTVIRGVQPFGQELAANTFYEVRIGEDSITALGSAVGTRLKEIQAPANVMRVKGFRPAKFSVFAGNGNAVYAQSKITRQYYLKYDGDNYSIPFGASSETEEEAQGAQVVKAAINNALGDKDIKRFSYQPERLAI